MSKKHEKAQAEPVKDEQILDFEAAKDMTIGQAAQKQQEIEAGITDTDGLLDRYIKQHRDEIESQKFETRTIPVIKDSTVIPVVESASLTSDELETAAAAVAAHSQEEPKPVESSPVVEPLKTPAEEVAYFDLTDGSEEKPKKKGFWIFGTLLAALIAILASLFFWMNQNNAGQTASSTSSSSSTKQSSSTTSSSSTPSEFTDFTKLYESFFTDSSLSKLKNSEFGKLEELKALLDKIDPDSDAYKEAKANYDKLEKAIAAVNGINEQFDKPILVDGELDTTATVKAGATLEAVATGISGVDATITSAVNFARSQEENQQAVAGVVASAEQAAPAAQAGTPAPAPAESSAASALASASTSPAEVQNAASQFGIPVPPGVTLQRHLSRVPYNQAMIDDVNNPAWTFNPGILEKIVETSQKRGYITGNQYILEKVNIINGNGYYNMFKPDGTYLFSINAKTGYFVGNARGNADALDY